MERSISRWCYMFQRDSFHTLIGSKEKKKPGNFPQLLKDATLYDRYQDSEINGTKSEPSKWTATGDGG